MHRSVGDLRSRSWFLLEELMDGKLELEDYLCSPHQFPPNLSTASTTRFTSDLEAMESSDGGLKATALPPLEAAQLYSSSSVAGSSESTPNKLHESPSRPSSAEDIQHRGSGSVTTSMPVQTPGFPDTDMAGGTGGIGAHQGTERHSVECSTRHDGAEGNLTADQQDGGPPQSPAAHLDWGGLLDLFGHDDAKVHATSQLLLPVDLHAVPLPVGVMSLLHTDSSSSDPSTTEGRQTDVPQQHQEQDMHVHTQSIAYTAATFHPMCECQKHGTNSAGHVVQASMQDARSGLHASAPAHPEVKMEYALVGDEHLAYMPSSAPMIASAAEDISAPNFFPAVASLALQPLLPDHTSVPLLSSSPLPGATLMAATHQPMALQTGSHPPDGVILSMSVSGPNPGMSNSPAPGTTAAAAAANFDVVAPNRNAGDRPVLSAAFRSSASSTVPIPAPATNPPLLTLPPHPYAPVNTTSHGRLGLHGPASGPIIKEEPDTAGKSTPAPADTGYNQQQQQEQGLPMSRLTSILSPSPSPSPSPHGGHTQTPTQPVLLPQRVTQLQHEVSPLPQQLPQVRQHAPQNQQQQEAVPFPHFTRSAELRPCPHPGLTVIKQTAADAMDMQPLWGCSPIAHKAQAAVSLRAKTEWAAEGKVPREGGGTGGSDGAGMSGGVPSGFSAGTSVEDSSLRRSASSKDWRGRVGASGGGSDSPSSGSSSLSGGQGGIGFRHSGSWSKRRQREEDGAVASVRNSKAASPMVSCGCHEGWGTRDGTLLLNGYDTKSSWTRIFQSALAVWYPVLICGDRLILFSLPSPAGCFISRQCSSASTPLSLPCHLSAHIPSQPPIPSRNHCCSNLLPASLCPLPSHPPSHCCKPVPAHQAANPCSAASNVLPRTGRPHGSRRSGSTAAHPAAAAAAAAGEGFWTTFTTPFMYP